MIRRLVGLFLILISSPACTQMTATHQVYWVEPYADDAADACWAEYLSDHLNRRSVSGQIAVTESPAGNDYLKVRVHVSHRLGRDYSIEKDGRTLTLAARDEDKMLWLLYQFMSALQDKRVDVSDLPPSVVHLEGDEGDFAFEYRGIYTSANMNTEMMPIMATHNVDYDWGIWGHNLAKVFREDIPNVAYALVDGKRTNQQFCFTSRTLFDAIESYIVDEFGEGEGKGVTQRFAIMPNDNEYVCMCAACKSVGNTARSATPAVAALIRRLAHRFPRHQFFMSAYLTTYTPPPGQLPANTGVIVSAMQLAMRADFRNGNAQVKRFARLVGDWRKAVGKVYVWDYMRNFDDFLTPYPCLSLLGERLRYYRSLGVKGIFYNGSGADYASFDDVQTPVLAALLINPDIDISRYTRACFKRHYPFSGDMLADTYDRWEHDVCQGGKVLPYYGGIDDAVKAWLEPESFVKFCSELDRKSKGIRDGERRRLNQLLTALQFTLLELQRMPQADYDAEAARVSVESLEGHSFFENMDHYREANGKLDDYIGQWMQRLNDPAVADNQLKGVRIHAMSPLDAGYKNLSVLTDGFRAFTTDYHLGWVINSSPQVELEMPAGSCHNGKKLSLSFLHAPRWRIVLPDKVELWQSGKCIGRMNVDKHKSLEPFTRYLFQCKLKGVNDLEPVVIRVLREEGTKKTVACDEIEMY